MRIRHSPVQHVVQAFCEDWLALSPLLCITFFGLTVRFHQGCGIQHALEACELLTVVRQLRLYQPGYEKSPRNQGFFLDLRKYEDWDSNPGPIG